MSPLAILALGATPLAIAVVMAAFPFVLSGDHDSQPPPNLDPLLEASAQLFAKGLLTLEQHERYVEHVLTDEVHFSAEHYLVTAYLRSSRILEPDVRVYGRLLDVDRRQAARQREEGMSTKGSWR